MPALLKIYKTVFLDFKNVLDHIYGWNGGEPFLGYSRAALESPLGGGGRREEEGQVQQVQPEPHPSTRTNFKTSRKHV